MLEHLFGSRTRARLLALFFHHPDEKFFVRELTRRIETQINAVRRELLNLVKVGLVKEEADVSDDPDAKRPGVKRKYYRIDRNFPLYRELHQLITKASIFLESNVQQRIARLGDIYYVAFLGAFLGIPKQPVDLFIVGTVSDKELRHLVTDFEKELGCELNYTVITPTEYVYRKDIADRFLTTVMSAQKNVLIDRLDVMLKA